MNTSIDIIFKGLGPTTKKASNYCRFFLMKENIIVFLIVSVTRDTKSPSNIDCPAPSVPPGCFSGFLPLLMAV
jgi:hypothetical protein